MEDWDLSLDTGDLDLLLATGDLDSLRDLSYLRYGDLVKDLFPEYKEGLCF